jgi:hypothetical protein
VIVKLDCGVRDCGALNPSLLTEGIARAANRIKTKGIFIYPCYGAVHVNTWLKGTPLGTKTLYAGKEVLVWNVPYDSSVEGEANTRDVPSWPDCADSVSIASPPHPHVR